MTSLFCMSIYNNCIRSIVDYAVSAFHFPLPKYLLLDLERYRRDQCQLYYCMESTYKNACNFFHLDDLATHHNNLYRLRKTT